MRPVHYAGAALAVLALLVGCSNTLVDTSDGVSPSWKPAAPRSGVAVSVDLGGLSGRALPTDGSVTGVRLVVVDASNEERFESVQIYDTNGDGVWTGEVNITDDKTGTGTVLTGSYIFKAVAYDTSGNAMYFGESGSTLIQTNNETVQIVMSAGAFGFIAVESVVKSDGADFLVTFSEAATLYYQVDGSVPDAATLKSTGTSPSAGPGLDGFVQITGKAASSTHTLYFIGERSSDNSQTDVYQISFTTTNDPVMSIDGSTNAPAGWMAVAVDFTGAPLAFGTVSAGTPNTYSISAVDTGSNYDTQIAFANPVNTHEVVIFSGGYATLTVTTGSTTIAGPDAYLYVSVTGLDTTYGSRYAHVLISESGTDNGVALGGGEITADGYLLITELVDYETGTTWNDGTSGTTYDVSGIGIAPAGESGEPEFQVTDPGGAAFATISTDAAGDPQRASGIIDVAGATYTQVPIIDAKRIYQTSTGEYSGQDVKLEVYSAGADPTSATPLATSGGNVDDAGTDGVRFSAFVDASSSSWTPVDSTTYDVYLRIYATTDGSYGSEVALSAGSATLPDPLYQFAWGALSMPLTIDVNATGTFN